MFFSSSRVGSDIIKQDPKYRIITISIKNIKYRKSFLKNYIFINPYKNVYFIRETMHNIMPKRPRLLAFRISGSVILSSSKAQYNESNVPDP